MTAKTIAILVAALLLAGCISENPYRANRYFSIDDPGAEVEASAEKTDCALAMLEFGASSRYDVRMIEHHPGNELVFSEYDRWVEKPSEMITVAMRNVFVASQTFTYVGDYSAIRDADYCITGSIRRFDEAVDDKGRRASLSVRCVLTRVSGGAMVWSDDIDVEISLDGEGPDAFATAMGRAVSAAAQQALKGVVAAIVEDQKNNPVPDTPDFRRRSHRPGAPLDE